MAILLVSIAKSHIQNLIKSLWWSFITKIVNNFQQITFFSKKTHHKCQTVLPVKKKNNSYTERDTYFLYFVPCLCTIFLLVCGCFKQAFFHLGDKKSSRFEGKFRRGMLFALYIALYNICSPPICSQYKLQATEQGRVSVLQ